MKKQILAIAAVLMLGFTSCEKDDNKNEAPLPTKDAQVVKLTNGEWDVKYVYMRTMVNDTLAFEVTDTINGTALFREDGTLVSNTPEIGTEESQWEMKGDSLFIDDELGLLIEELTDNKFVMAAELADEEMDSVRFNILVRFTLTR